MLTSNSFLFTNSFESNSFVSNSFVSNSFVNTFLIVILFNILNLGTHDNNCTPNFFPYDFESSICNIKINKGSVYCYNIHIHHWILGAVGLCLTLLFLRDSAFKSIINGILFAITIDGLLFSDRFEL